MTIGEAAFRYRIDEEWAHQDAAARGVLSSVACDRHGRVYLCSREPDPKILVYDADGARLDCWTHPAFRHPGGIHGISVTPDDTLYVTDVLDHVVHRFTLDGTLLAESIDYWGHCVCVAPTGDLYWTHVGGPDQLARYVRVAERP